MAWPVKMALFVSACFNVDIKSAKADGVPVEVYSINLWKAGHLLSEILKGVQWNELCVLVQRKRNNGPLKATINFLSKKGVKIYLNGNDGSKDERLKLNKLCVGTWHSSKGTEIKIAIVLGVKSDAALNPCFVACTRGIERLVVVQDVDNPYLPLMNAIKQLILAFPDIYCSKL